MQVIPAIDIIDGKCVRLTEGDFARKRVYNEQPLEVALQFQDAGLKRLHLVDLDGARAGAVRNWKVLEQIAGKTELEIDFGGGIKSEEDLRIVFNSGAVLATVGSIAVKEEKIFAGWIQNYGGDKFLLGADVNEEKIAINGWQDRTDIPVMDFIKKFVELGIVQLFCTDVSRDGRLEGPATELYKKIVERFPDLYFIASGGVGSLADLEELSQAGCRAAIVGKAIYENRILLKDLKSFL